jgi:hypothetical protein
MKEEHESPLDGNELVIDVEVGDQVIPFKVTCPVCQRGRYWLSEDRTLLYCSKCRTVIAKRFQDTMLFDQVSWRL